MYVFFCAPFVIEPHRLCPGLGQDPKGHKKICDKIRYLRGASIIYHGQLQWLFNKIIGKKMIVNRVCLSCFQSKFHSLTFHKACALCRRNFLIKNIKIFVFIEFFFCIIIWMSIICIKITFIDHFDTMQINRLPFLYESSLYVQKYY